MTVVSEEVVKCCCDPGGGGGPVFDTCIDLYNAGDLDSAYTVQFTWSLVWIENGTGDQTSFDVTFTFPVEYDGCNDFGGGFTQCFWRSTSDDQDYTGSASSVVVTEFGTTVKNASYPDDFELPVIPVGAEIRCTSNSGVPTEWRVAITLNATLPTPDPGSISADAGDWDVEFDMPPTYHPTGTWNPTTDEVAWQGTPDTIAQAIRSLGHTLVSWSGEVIVS